MPEHAMAHVIFDIEFECSPAFTLPLEVAFLRGVLVGHGYLLFFCRGRFQYGDRHLGLGHVLGTVRLRHIHLWPQRRQTRKMSEAFRFEVFIPITLQHPYIYAIGWKKYLFVLDRQTFGDSLLVHGIELEKLHGSRPVGPQVLHARFVEP